MPAGHKGQPRDIPAKSLNEIFDAAIQQPRHVAVPRMKVAYWFHMTDATIQDTIDDAFDAAEIPPLSKSGISKIINVGIGASTEDQYWRRKVLLDHIEARLAPYQKKDIFALACKASLLDRNNVQGTDADAILDELQDFAFPERRGHKGGIVLLNRYLSELGFSDQAVAFLTSHTNAPDVVDIICENEDATSNVLDALQSFLRSKITGMANDNNLLGRTADSPK